MNTRNLNQRTVPQSSETINPKQSRLISKVLSPALRLWLRSQVERVSHLEVKIAGSDRQILTGKIPRVSISAQQAVYQGLHLSQIQLTGESIHTNLRQVLRGQPLRLVEPVLVSGELFLQEADLNASLQSSVLSNALTELVQLLIPASYPLEKQVSWHKITLAPEQLTLNGIMADSRSTIPLLLQCGLQLASCHELQLTQPQLQSPDISLEKLENFHIDLGSEVDLQELTLHPGQLVCRGSIIVMP